DQRAAAAILVAERMAARNRKPAVVLRSPAPRADIRQILSIALRQSGDRRRTQTDDRVAHAHVVALERAPQLLASRRFDQWVVRQREVVEADSDIAEPGELVMSGRGLLEALSRRRQRLFIDQALPLL